MTHSTRAPRRSPVADAVVDVVEAAAGRRRRDDEVLPATGGPAGNAKLTAITGLVLVALLAVEAVTLLDVNGLMSWHAGVGAALVPVVLLKTGSTGWRMVRYYGGNRPYKKAGPPPMILRIVGPVLVLSTLAVLGTGLALIALGTDAGHSTIVTLLGQRIDTVTLHQLSFIVFAVAIAIHVIARFVPALQEFGERPVHEGGVPGGRGRVVLVVLSLAAALLAALLVLGPAGAWHGGFFFRYGGPPH